MARLNAGEARIAPGVQFHVPVRADGKGRLTVEDDVVLGFQGAPKLGAGEILLQARTPNAEIRVESGCRFSNNVSIVARESITMKRDCLVGDSVCVLDSDFHVIDPATRRKGPGLSAPVVIERNVWLGSRVMILKGVRIGENSIIAPMSVVTKDVPANVIAAGVPARVVRELDAPEAKSEKG